MYMDGGSVVKKVPSRLLTKSASGVLNIPVKRETRSVFRKNSASSLQREANDAPERQSSLRSAGASRTTGDEDGLSEQPATASERVCEYSGLAFLSC